MIASRQERTLRLSAGHSQPSRHFSAATRTPSRRRAVRRSSTRKTKRPDTVVPASGSIADPVIADRPARIEIGSRPELSDGPVEPDEEASVRPERRENDVAPRCSTTTRRNWPFSRVVRNCNVEPGARLRSKATPTAGSGSIRGGVGHREGHRRENETLASSFIAVRSRTGRAATSTARRRAPRGPASSNRRARPQRGPQSAGRATFGSPDEALARPRSTRRRRGRNLEAFGGRGARPLQQTRRIRQTRPVSTGPPGPPIRRAPDAPGAPGRDGDRKTTATPAAIRTAAANGRTTRHGRRVPAAVAPAGEGTSQLQLLGAVGADRQVRDELVPLGGRAALRQQRAQASRRRGNRSGGPAAWRPGTRPEEQRHPASCSIPSVRSSRRNRPARGRRGPRFGLGEAEKSSDRVAGEALRRSFTGYFRPPKVGQGGLQSAPTSCCGATSSGRSGRRLETPAPGGVPALRPPRRLQRTFSPSGLTVTRA